MSSSSLTSKIDNTDVSIQGKEKTKGFNTVYT